MKTRCCIIIKNKYIFKDVNYLDYQEQLLKAIEKQMFFEGRKDNLENKEEYHIGYGIDDNYARCLGASIASICSHNQDQQFVFHILASNLELKSIEKIEQLADEFKINIHLYSINEKVFQQLPTQEHLPVSTYYRFILPMLLKVKKVLYLDADIICLGSIQYLFHLDMADNIVAAVADAETIAHKRNMALNLKNHTYFNAGVLLINRQKWNDDNVVNKVIDALAGEPKKFRYLDQDALNLILTGKIYYLDRIWNRINTTNMNANENIILLHFAAHPKPWNIAWNISDLCNNFTKDLYAHYEKLSPWKDAEPVLPRNYKEMKNYAKCLLEKGDYIQGFSWYIKYIKTKFSTKC